MIGCPVSRASSRFCSPSTPPLPRLSHHWQGSSGRKARRSLIQGSSTTHHQDGAGPLQTAMTSICTPLEWKRKVRPQVATLVKQTPPARCWASQVMPSQPRAPMSSWAKPGRVNHSSSRRSWGAVVMASSCCFHRVAEGCQELAFPTARDQRNRHDRARAHPGSGTLQRRRRVRNWFVPLACRGASYG